MSDFQTDYQSLISCTEGGSDTPQDNDVIFHVPPEKARWNHIEDLDSFFRKGYHYQQKHGFWCILTSEVYGIVQFVFIVVFTIFISNCIDYEAVGRQISFQNATYIEKLKVTDLVIPANTCISGFSAFTWICIIVSIIFGIYYICRTLCRLLHYYEIKLFYNSALKIPCCELDNTSWHDVQCKFREVQQVHQMCIHKRDLTELDIYHRILRHENYMVAMVNKNVLPMKYNVPFVGEMVYFSTGLRFNIEWLLFRSPISPFRSTWQLKEDYKKFNKRNELAASLSKWILFLGLLNFALFPFIFLWQLLHFCVNYAGHIRKEPSILGSRRWSQYSRLYLRHLNELDHELTARFNRAYKPSCDYMNSFSSHQLTIHARNISGVAGVIAVFIIIWSALQNDIIEVDYVITIGAVTTLICHAVLCLVPDENLVFRPAVLMTHILADIHYMPDHWKNKAHTVNVRNEFSQLFQLKLSYILEQLISPIVTPMVLIFYLQQRSLDIVDFFRSFTVEVAGVGDVCSFALMDISRHGNHQWLGEPEQTRADQFQQAENGKTELSLMHFTMTNPNWQPPPSSNIFINNLKDQAQRDGQRMNLMQIADENPLYSSLHSLYTVGEKYAEFCDGVSGNFKQRADQNNLGHSMFSSRYSANHNFTGVVCGAVSQSEGPLYCNQSGTLSSLQVRSPQEEVGSIFQHQRMLNPPEYRIAHMSLSALYLHELHHQHLRSVQQPRSNIMQAPHEETPENQPLLDSKTER